MTAPPRRKSVGLKVTQPKYNLFSILDQPFNSILNGGSCTCPANELIASQRSEANWENIKKQEEGLFWLNFVLCKYNMISILYNSYGKIDDSRSRWNENIAGV